MEDKVKKTIKDWEIKKLKKHETDGQMWSVGSKDEEFSIEVAAASKDEAFTKAVDAITNSEYMRGRLGIESE